MGTENFREDNSKEQRITPGGNGYGPIALQLEGIVADNPPPAPAPRCALCRSPDEFLAHWERFGNSRYAVVIADDDSGKLDDVWFFEDDLQDAVAIGMRWHERGCALEQYPEVQGGEIVYGYRVKNLPNNRALEDLLYTGWFWDGVRADVNAVATSEMMTRLREHLFTTLATWTDHGIFLVLDFSLANEIEEFLANWEDEFDE
ncbi:MAG: transposase [Candidimonas sp.]|nr:transposase [Candidimonas sp.]